MNIRVGTVTSVSGKVVRGYLPIGERADGSEIVCPLAIAAGSDAGPVLWLQDCAHGDEIGGVLGLQTFLRELAPCTHKGTVICVMISIPAAFSYASEVGRLVGIAGFGTDCPY